MQCPFCGQDSDKVVDSRSSEGGRAVRRRRECLACNRRYTTYERPEDVLRISVIKKDGSREPYDRQKIIAGLQKACYKRPITDEQILGVLEAAEEESSNGSTGRFLAPLSATGSALTCARWTRSPMCDLPACIETLPTWAT